MASVFPDTSVNNPDTGFAWADGDIWNDPDSGLTYSWYNPVWKTGGAGAANNFVLVAGDNMTGDLTLGTDKIKLDASGGGATFKGNVEANVFFSRTGTGAGPLTQIGGPVNALLSRRDGNNNTVVIEQNTGNATFAGGITSTSTGFSFLAADSSTPTTTSAYGYMTRGQVNINQTTANPVFIGSLNGTQTSVIDSSGAATFAGAVISGDLPSNGGANGCALGAASGVQATGNAAGSYLFRGWQNGSSTITSSIKADGSALFAGTGIELAADTTVYAGGFSAGAGKAQIFGNGSATFASYVSSTRDVGGNFVPAIGSLNSSPGSFPSVGDTLGIQASEVGAAVNTGCFLGANGNWYFSGTGNTRGITIETEADDDTKYTTTTDSEGVETRVYNGAVLDVKDRIQNVLARMDAIEANEITDDATDSALLTLIASLSARLDERDAAIAALTARVSTLES